MNCLGSEKNWEGLSALQILMKVAVEGHVPDYSHLPDFVCPLCNMCLKPKGKRAPASSALCCSVAQKERVSWSMTLLTLARACAAKGYCSRSVGRSVGRSVCLCVYLFPRFLSNRGCCRYQTWICGYVQRALGTARVWSGVVQEQHVYGGGLKLYTVIILGVR